MLSERSIKGLFVVCLIKTGINGKMLDIIRSIYSEVKSHIKHNNIISPVFLATYVSDMESAYRHSFCYLLAHLSRRLTGELIHVVYPCSGVRPSVVVHPSVVHHFQRSSLKPLDQSKPNFM